MLFVIAEKIGVINLDEPVYFENYNLENIVTPVRVNELQYLLEESKYDQNKIEYLIQGFQNGFDIGYRGPENVQLRALNLKFREVGNEVILWNKVMKEVKAKMYAGPFAEIPFQHYIQSPIGLV